jgi:hypothetical protein
MTLHENIVTDMQRYIDDRRDCAIISPTAVAVAAYQHFANAEVEAHIHYGCLEHFKAMARRALAARFTDEGDENLVYADQGQLFADVLQERYPLPRSGDAEPTYKLRSQLTTTERAWNVAMLRKSADARQKHADALEAEGRGNKRA